MAAVLRTIAAAILVRPMGKMAAYNTARTMTRMMVTIVFRIERLTLIQTLIQTQTPSRCPSPYTATIPGPNPRTLVLQCSEFCRASIRWQTQLWIGGRTMYAMYAMIPRLPQIPSRSLLPPQLNRCKHNNMLLTPQPKVLSFGPYLPSRSMQKRVQQVLLPTACTRGPCRPRDRRPRFAPFRKMPRRSFCVPPCTAIGLQAQPLALPHTRLLLLLLTPHTPPKLLGSSLVHQLRTWLRSSHVSQRPSTE